MRERLPHCAYEVSKKVQTLIQDKQRHSLFGAKMLVFVFAVVEFIVQQHKAVQISTFSFTFKLIRAL